mmetsp:Transcript_2638/g.4260  ORF Transcript_2638/g.4260 Transcript_2638/m.4260 type:complete len:213 (-) Transcript_2638:53-691(-)
MNTVTLFTVFFLIAYAFALDFSEIGTRDCNKVSNATDCVWYDDSDFGVLTSAFSQLKLEPVDSFGSDRQKFSACISPLISEICVNVEVDPWGDFFSNVTLSITVDRITIWSIDTTIPQLLQENGGICLDDDTVLEILALIPSLQDDIEVILAILDATGCEPRGLFSMCFYFNPCEYYDPYSNICGCFEFDFQLLYWRKYCLYKFDGNIGCIN